MWLNSYDKWDSPLRAKGSTEKSSVLPGDSFFVSSLILEAFEFLSGYKREKQRSLLREFQFYVLEKCSKNTVITYCFFYLLISLTVLKIPFFKYCKVTINTIYLTTKETDTLCHSCSLCHVLLIFLKHAITSQNLTSSPSMKLLWHKGQWLEPLLDTGAERETGHL